MVGELGIFATLVENLNNIGFYGFVLPWLLVFAIVFGALSKTNLDKKVSGLISLVIAFFVAAYPGVGQLFAALMGPAALILAIILIIVLFIEMAGLPGIGGGDQQKEKTFGLEVAATIIVIAVIVGIILMGGGTTTISSEVWAAIFMIIVVIAAIWFVGKS